MKPQVENLKEQTKLEEANNIDSKESSECATVKVPKLVKPPVKIETESIELYQTESACW